jgi:NUMOD4 motif/HNH endonuclease/Helix-turn-helix domain of resolvase
MATSLPTKKESWKKIEFDFKYTNENNFEISNLGRIRSFYKSSAGNILNCSTIKGYKIFRYTFLAPLTNKALAEVKKLSKPIAICKQELADLKSKTTNKKNVLVKEKELKLLVATLTKFNASNNKLRAIKVNLLVHRLVAQYFLKAPKKEADMVCHLDYNYLNNEVANLKWITKKENILHQRTNPKVLKARAVAIKSKTNSIHGSKINDDSAAKIKRMIADGKATKIICEKFNISSTQLYRIKRGENWGHIAMASK